MTVCYGRGYGGKPKGCFITADFLKEFQGQNVHIAEIDSFDPSKKSPANKPQFTSITFNNDGTTNDSAWLWSGQSNMAGKMRHAPAEKADYPALRQWVAPETGPWLVCSPETVPEFKRVCFYFSRRLQSGILVPVGIINAAVGGSNIESWLNQKPFETGANYVKHIEPLVGSGLRGVIWYQGESNEKDKREYFVVIRLADDSRQLRFPKALDFDAATTATARRLLARATRHAWPPTPTPKA